MHLIIFSAGTLSRALSFSRLFFSPFNSCIPPSLSPSLSDSAPLCSRYLLSLCRISLNTRRSRGLRKSKCWMGPSKPSWWTTPRQWESCSSQFAAGSVQSFFFNLQSVHQDSVFEHLPVCSERMQTDLIKQNVKTLH